MPWQVICNYFFKLLCPLPCYSSPFWEQKESIITIISESSEVPGNTGQQILGGWMINRQEHSGLSKRVQNRFSVITAFPVNSLLFCPKCFCGPTHRRARRRFFLFSLFLSQVQTAPKVHSEAAPLESSYGY